MKTKNPKLSLAARQLIKDIRTHRKVRTKAMAEANKVEAQIDKLEARRKHHETRAEVAEGKCVETITHLVGALVECGFEPEDAFNYATEVK